MTLASPGLTLVPLPPYAGCDAWNFFADDPDRVRSITNRDYAKAIKG